MTRLRYRASASFIALILTACVSAPRSVIDPERDLVLELQVSPSPVYLGQPVVLSLSLVNRGATAIQICRTGDWSVALGTFNQRTFSAHLSCVAANRRTLGPGEWFTWQQSFDLTGRCDPAAIAQYPFLAGFSLCPGHYSATVEAEFFTGSNCTRKDPCTIYTARTHATVAVGPAG